MCRTLGLFAVVLLGGCGGGEAACVGSAAPNSITEMVDLLNELPQPVTVPCMIDSLQRPLRMEATTNPFSAQPADGPLSPRMFLFIGDLSISVVPSGPGAEVVEFGQVADATHTIKGELAFPIRDEVLQTDPHERVFDGDAGTVCAECHVQEAPVNLGDAGTGWASSAIGADPETVMPIDLVREQADGCVDSDLRCEVFKALFDGEVEHQEFSDQYPTIYELSPDG